MKIKKFNSAGSNAVITAAFTIVITAFLSFINAFGAVPTAVYDFDGDYGDATAIERDAYYSDDGLVTCSGSSFTYSDGKKGQCLHMNGTEALKLNVNMTSESYTVSYWLKPDVITNCTPSLMITPSGFIDETFINITLAVDNISPNIWTHMIEPYDERNSTGIPGLLSTSEWLHITMVVDENMSSSLLDEFGIRTDEYTTPVALYADGYLISVGKVPKGLCIDSTTYWFGVNIWDDLYSGYVDELYFYDTALNEDEIKELFINSGGDPDAPMPTGSLLPNDNVNNNGSFSDDFVAAEHTTVNANLNHLNMDNASPVTTQGVDSTTNAYAKTAFIFGLSLLLLAAGFFLQYIKRKNNSYS